MRYVITREWIDGTGSRCWELYDEYDDINDCMFEHERLTETASVARGEKFFIFKELTSEDF